MEEKRQENIVLNLIGNNWSINRRYAVNVIVVTDMIEPMTWDTFFKSQIA